MESGPYDPWQKCKTYSGLDADLVISALQKEIRRSNVENAAVLAYEMIMTSEEMESYLWFRLKTISVEDIGFADLQAPILIASLDRMRTGTRAGGDRHLLAIHAVRYLCHLQKDRSSDEMLCWIKKGYERGTVRPHIPPYAVDKHTLQGQLAGKGEVDFYEEGALVDPEWEGRDKSYLTRILTILEEKESTK